MSPIEMSLIEMSKNVWELNSPPEGDEVSVERDIIDDPFGEGDLADVDELAAADRILDFHDLESSVEKSKENKMYSISLKKKFQ